MTITRLWQGGAESNGTGSLSEFDSYVGTVLAASSTYAKTGTYSFRFGGSTTNANVLVPETYQLRTGLHIRGANLVTPTNPTTLFAFRTSSASLVSVRVKNAAELQLLVGSTEQDTCYLATPMPGWRHFGFDAKIDASAGWAVLYVDGLEIMRFEGNTGSSAITVMRYGGSSSSESFDLKYAYYDDLFVDDTTGEAAAAVVPDVCLTAIVPNGNGTYADGVGSDGNSTDNYALVDERPHNSDTDYVILSAADEQESYAMSTITLPGGSTAAAVIPFVYALKTDGATATQIATLLRLSSTDVEGTAQDMPTSYSWLWERFTTKPGGGAWDQSAIDDLEVGYQGEGTF